MRILLLNHEYPPLGGGAGNATARIAHHLAKLGVEPFVLTTRFHGQPEFELQDGVAIRRIRALRRHIDRSSIIEFGAFSALGMIPLLRLIAKWRPEAIIAFSGIPAGLMALAVRMIYGIPYIVSLRGGDVPGFWYRGLSAYHALARPLIRLIWQKAGAVAANSKGLQQLALRTAPDLPIEIIPNGVDCEFFRQSNEAKKGSPVRLLLVGRLVAQKGVDILLSAVSQLLPSLQKGIALDLVGDGEDRPQFEDQSRQHGLSEVVRFHGWLSRADLVKVYQKADIFCLPSRDEGMPNVVLEAMACGLPVIATRISGNEELVKDGETGLLIPAEDPASLAQALTRLVSDGDLRQRMGRAGRVRVEEHFTWRRTAEDYLALVKKVLEAL